eukprot:6867479-Prymnesium_polylepis.1
MARAVRPRGARRQRDVICQAVRGDAPQRLLWHALTGAYQVAPRADLETRVPAVARSWCEASIVALPEAVVCEAMQPRHCGAEGAGLRRIFLPVGFVVVLKLEDVDRTLCESLAHALEDKGIVSLRIDAHHVGARQLHVAHVVVHSQLLQRADEPLVLSAHAGRLLEGRDVLRAQGHSDRHLDAARLVAYRRLPDGTGDTKVCECPLQPFDVCVEQLKGMDIHASRRAQRPLGRLVTGTARTTWRVKNFVGDGELLLPATQDRLVGLEAFQLREPVGIREVCLRKSLHHGCSSIPFVRTDIQEHHVGVPAHPRCQLVEPPAAGASAVQRQLERFLHRMAHLLERGGA